MPEVKAVAPDEGRLFQEYLSPFWMIVACMLVNRTHWRQAKIALKALMDECQGPDLVACGKLAKMDTDKMLAVLRPLGFRDQRHRSIKATAVLWGIEPPRNARKILELPGCGQYAYQSWLIFVEGKRPEGGVTDHKLQWYLDMHPEVI